MEGLFPNPVPLLKACASTWNESPSSNSDMVEVCPTPQERFVQVLILPTNRTLFGNGGLHRCSEDSPSEEDTIQWSFTKENRQTQGGGWVNTKGRLDGCRSPESEDGLFPCTLQSNLGTSLDPLGQPGYLPGPSRATLALFTSWFCIFSRTVRLWVSASLTLSFQ